MDTQSVVAMVHEAQQALKDKKEVRVRLSDNAETFRVAAIEAKSQISVGGANSRSVLLYVEVQPVDGGRMLIAPQHIVAIISS